MEMRYFHTSSEREINFPHSSMGNRQANGHQKITL